MLAQLTDIDPWRFQFHPEVWILVAFPLAHLLVLANPSSFFGQLDMDEIMEVVHPSEVIRALARAVADGRLRLDASGDGTISALDALRVINALAQQSLTSEAESVGAVSLQASWASSVDSVLGDLDDDEDVLLALLIEDHGLHKARP